MAVYWFGRFFSLKLTIFMWVSFQISGSISLLILNTTTWFNYTYLDDFEIYVRDINSIVFMVKAANDAHISLSETIYMHTRDSYEVVIGGWGNQRSVIRKCDQCLPKSSLHHHPLSAHEYRPFWISWEGGLIQLGNGTVPQEDQLIEWMDPEPYTVNHMGVSTGWGADGSWVFDFPPPTWLAWSAWSQCNSTCGFSIQQRMRHCTEEQPIYDIGCHGTSVETVRCDVPNCPIDGAWSSWEPWNTCSRTCSAGTQSRERKCDSPVPQYGGEVCPGDYTQMRRCDYGPCPVNGAWSAWTQWSLCTSSCGGGNQERTRICNNPSPQFEGQNCSGDSMQSRTCASIFCPINGGWSEWSSWATCSVTCGGGGTQTRSRQCDNPTPQYGGSYCSENNSTSQTCGEKNCPVNGSWSPWLEWSSCSLSCGIGTQQRQRQCDNPQPSYGGMNCSGDEIEAMNCDLKPCAVNGSWSLWLEWGSCSLSCGIGTQQRHRLCDSPQPSYGGLNCSGDIIESKNCDLQPCAVNGNWSTWSEWSSCSLTCGVGKQQRHRLCDRPQPSHGGMDCLGDEEETRNCGLQSCAVDGEWSTWGLWTECSTSCGRGSQARSRDCDNPEPQNGGNYCIGNELVYRSCSVIPCPVEGGWTEWTTWSDCSSTCGEGIALRERDCTDPAPQYGGADCAGQDTDRQDCFLTDCQIHGGWSSWKEWGPCSSTCGWSLQMRDRECDDPRPQFGGDACQGKTNDTKKCIIQRCPVDGMWGQWTQWSLCSTSCSYGSRERLRNCSDPSPAYGGTDCIGLKSETKTCYDKECPQDGSWTKWSLWSSCTMTCGGGQKERVRFCTNPSPRYNGKHCQGNGKHVQPCNIMDCPEIVALVAEEEIEPVEAPGAVSIGMIGVAFCGVLLAFVIVLDLATISRHFAYMKRNMRHIKYKVLKQRGRETGETNTNISIEENPTSSTSNITSNSHHSIAFVENESESIYDHNEKCGKYGSTPSETYEITHDDIVLENIYTQKERNIDSNNVHKRKSEWMSGSTKL